MADPDKKKPDLSDFLSKFADRNPFAYAKTAKESEKFITPSRPEKNDKIENHLKKLKNTFLKQTEVFKNFSGWSAEKHKKYNFKLF